jgi:hypothetical protein
MDNMNSDGAQLDIPPSSAPLYSAPAVPSDEPDEIRAIWGTTVNLAETMKLFREFLRGFKPKYRAAHDREVGRRSHAFASPEEGEILLYENYLRRMRQTGETNLNLDMVNLVSYPPCRKLHTQLVKYPQEVIPAMDQVLKDLMLEIADMDQQAGVDDMVGDLGDAEVAEIMGRVYKVRPYGLAAVNMRELNPSGEALVVHIILSTSIQNCPRYRQTRVYKRLGDPCHSRHTGHESSILQVSCMLAHRTGRDRPWKDRRTGALSSRCLWFRGHNVTHTQQMRICGSSGHTPARDA